VNTPEKLVLSAILTLYDEAYSLTIHTRVQELAGRKSPSLGHVYYTLDRLEDQGMVSSWLTEPAQECAERGNRAKRCYRLEALGERALERPPATALQRILEARIGKGAKAWGRV
jgi:PadR family transcriptional regulator PadR